MSLVLARIDERLVHGQVVVAWVPDVDAQALLVADDAAAADPWEADLIGGAAPPGLSVTVSSLEGAAGTLAAGVSPRTVLLVRSPVSMLTLVRLGAPVTRVNVGGLHYRPGTRRWLDYVYVDREDIAALTDLHREGVRLTAQDVPSHPASDLGASLAEERLAFDRLPARDP